LIAAAVLFSVPCRAEPLISAQSAIVMDAASGRILFEKDAERRALIASTTKIMTALLIAENCNPDSVVSIPEEAAGIEGSSLYLKAGDCRTVEELLYGMMLHSGNDAAAALAGYCCGSEAAFVECMNDRAGELGLSETSFANPHGLDSEKNYSTAKELAVLAAAAMENPLFRRVVGTKTISFGDRTYTNHNKLLFRNSDCIGIKTGYTKAAGRILVSAAERDGRRLIAVTIQAPHDWDDHEKLLDYGFSTYDLQEIAATGSAWGTVPVIGGSENAQAVLREAVCYPLAEGETVAFQCELPQFVYAPVLAGEQAGTLRVLLNDQEIFRLPLFWRYSVMEDA